MKNAIKTFVTICMIVCLLPIEALAQQALWGNAPVVSPEIHENNTVTFPTKLVEPMQLQASAMPSYR